MKKCVPKHTGVMNPIEGGVTLKLNFLKVLLLAVLVVFSYNPSNARYQLLKFIVIN